MWQPHALVNYRENSLVHPLQMAGIELQTTNWGSKALSIPTLSRSSQHCIDIIDFSLESGRRSEQGGYLRAPRSKSHYPHPQGKRKRNLKAALIRLKHGTPLSERNYLPTYTCLFTNIWTWDIILDIPNTFKSTLFMSHTKILLISSKTFRHFYLSFQQLKLQFEVLQTSIGVFILRLWLYARNYFAITMPLPF